MEARRRALNVGSHLNGNWAAGPSTKVAKPPRSRRRKERASGGRRNRTVPEDQLGIFERAPASAQPDRPPAAGAKQQVAWREPSAPPAPWGHQWQPGPMPAPAHPFAPAFPSSPSTPPRPDLPSAAAPGTGFGPTPEQVARSRAEFRNPSRTSTATAAGRKRGTIQIGIGAALVAGGAVATAVGHASAVNAGGGTYIIWTGPMIAGVINVIRGALRFRGS